MRCPASLGDSSIIGEPFFLVNRFEGFGAHTRAIQARHVVRGLMSETTLTGMNDHEFEGLGFRVLIRGPHDNNGKRVLLRNLDPDLLG